MDIALPCIAKVASALDWALGEMSDDLRVLLEPARFWSNWPAATAPAEARIIADDMRGPSSDDDALIERSTRGLLLQRDMQRGVWDDGSADAVLCGTRTGAVGGAPSVRSGLNGCDGRDDSLHLDPSIDPWRGGGIGGGIGGGGTGGEVSASAGSAASGSGASCGASASRTGSGSKGDSITLSRGTCCGAAGATIEPLGAVDTCSGGAELGISRRSGAGGRAANSSCVVGGSTAPVCAGCAEGAPPVQFARTSTSSRCSTRSRSAAHSAAGKAACCAESLRLASTSRSSSLAVSGLRLRLPPLVVPFGTAEGVPTIRRQRLAGHMGPRVVGVTPAAVALSQALTSAAPCTRGSLWIAALTSAAVTAGADAREVHAVAESDWLDAPSWFGVGDSALGVIGMGNSAPGVTSTRVTSARTPLPDRGRGGAAHDTTGGGGASLAAGCGGVPSCASTETVDSLRLVCADSVSSARSTGLCGASAAEGATERGPLQALAVTLIAPDPPSTEPGSNADISSETVATQLLRRSSPSPLPSAWPPVLSRASPAGAAGAAARTPRAKAASAAEGASPHSELLSPSDADESARLGAVTTSTRDGLSSAGAD
eukprot:scaffold11326_cov101-Isochrysis_galbana.AAC.2